MFILFQIAIYSSIPAQVNDFPQLFHYNPQLIHLNYSKKIPTFLETLYHPDFQLKKSCGKNKFKKNLVLQWEKVLFCVNLL